VVHLPSRTHCWHSQWMYAAMTHCISVDHVLVTC
jgi:hypothetical protein